ncbi:M56 family metallopeptidase [Altibacter sp. HG106]|uniref:M56 family metallopeptidase n=1 Tax=Altibacter sp. HG106 TaxID=3023937 RepID=UPI0023500CD0|nr:M56 family metallopeptidase [Altibacter sp. HG106]MDC7995810.1 M56 family metallopeptidase [Altibacter sp. HG106]
MEPLLYLAKSALLLVIFFGIYHFLLRRDTHFTAHRWFLTGGIVASLTVPFIALTRIVYKEVIPLSETTSETIIPTQTIATVIESNASIPWTTVVLGIYLAGVTFFLLRLVWRLTIVLRMVTQQPSVRKSAYRYVQVTEPIRPFSFFHYIVYNPTQHPEVELQMILQHERAHARQWHSLDVVFAHLLIAIQWCNPFAWWYKKDMEENLEFLADHTTAQDVPSKKDYQLALLRISSPEATPVLTTPFYQSFIKKRIIMLNKEHSKKSNLWKMSWVLPLIAVFLWSFNVKEEVVYQPTQKTSTTYPNTNIPSEAVTGTIVSEPLATPPMVASTSTTSTEVTSETEDPIETGLSEERDNSNNLSLDNQRSVTSTPVLAKERYLITKNTTDAELDDIKADIKKTHNIDLSYEVQRNSQGEIYSLRIQHRGNGNNGNFHVNDDEGISDFYFLIDDEGRSSFWSEGMEERTQELALRAQERAKRLEERMVEREERMKRRFDERKEERLALMEERRGNRLTEKREELAERREELAERREELALRRAELNERRSRTNRSFGLHDNENVFFESNGDSDAVVITKDMSDAQLEELKRSLKARDVVFSYKRVKRNERNEITSLKIELKKGDRAKTVTTIDSDDGNPIETVFIAM